MRKKITARTLDLVNELLVAFENASETEQEEILASYAEDQGITVDEARHEFFELGAQE